MNLIKVRFLKDNQPTGKAYTYDSPVAVKPGDIVQINSSATGVVVEVNVPEEEVAAFRDKVKSIVGLVVEKEKPESMEELGEGLCEYCPLPEGARGAHLYPNGHYSCEGSHCKEAYETYLDEFEEVQP